MKNWQNKELTQFLKERRHERLMEKVGIAIIKFFLVAGISYLISAWIISLTLN